MKQLLTFLCVFLLSLSAQSQDAPNQEMLEKLFGDHENLKALEATIADAREKGVQQQTLDEALFLYHIRSETEGELAKHIGRFEKGITNYSSKNAIITQTPDEWRALVTFCRAIDASNKSDAAGFKKHITEAFWLNPGNAEIFATPILRIRAREAMAKINVDFKTELLDTAGKPTTLAEHIKDNKAILVDFWASWCEPCMELMPELQAKSDLLAKHGIAVVAINTEGDPAIATAVQADQKMTLPWLVEPKTEPFSKLLQIDTLPRMVLITPDGKVLYNDHPSNPKLWDVLKKVAPGLSAPK